MVVEVAQLVTFVSGAAGSVGLVATSVLGVKVVLQTLKHLRAAGLSPVEIHQEIRRMAEVHHHMQQRENMTPEDRQAEKDAYFPTAQDMEDQAWQRHDELKESGFKNELPPTTGHKFF